MSDQSRIAPTMRCHRIPCHPSAWGVIRSWATTGTRIEEYSVKTGHLDSESRGKFLESNKHTSLLKFNSKTEKLRVENLQKLTGLIVEFPFLRSFTRFLTSLPLTGFYHLLFYLHLGYCHKIRLSPVKSTREVQIWLGTLFRLLSKT